MSRREVAFASAVTAPQTLIALAAMTLLTASFSIGPASPGRGDGSGGEQLQYRVGFLGVPSSLPHQAMVLPVAWNEANVGRLKALGFNTIQINLAWGSRPADETLNLEDVVELPAEQQREFPQPVPLRCDPSPQRRMQRRADLRARIALCRGAGLRTIFHFGAPYNAHCRYGDGPPNCISDPKVTERYALLLQSFARDFPGVDDILLYTYDQDAWLCSEFGPCPRCLGVPLHKRLPPLLNRLAAEWQKLSPQGRLWWEPWELSAGQVLRCVEEVDPAGFGLAIHCNIAEVMATQAADRWFKNTCRLAAQRGIPVLGEYFLGAASEELEPLTGLSHPLVTLRGLKAMAAMPLAGVKEYYGLAPDREDPNLRMTSLFFRNPAIGEEEALAELARPYGPAAAKVADFWKLTSEAMELFPWETAWHLREIGRSDPDHSLSAAILRGMKTHTPSWMSSRHATFMRIEPEYPPDPWMLEDVQLRCELAAARMAKAAALGRQMRDDVPQQLAERFAHNLDDLGRFERRSLAYAYHLRETNLARMMWQQRQHGEQIPASLAAELRAVLKTDEKNQVAEKPSAPPPAAIAAAIALFDRDPDQFLKTYFQDGPDLFSKGWFSVTSP
jgi:hypothetical protein